MSCGFPTGNEKRRFKPYILLTSLLWRVNLMDARNKDPQKLVNATAEKLSGMKELAPPAWSRFAKTGTSKERGPDSQNWWSVRAASILRRIYIDGPVGTSRLRTVYGSRKHRGTQRDH